MNLIRIYKMFKRFPTLDNIDPSKNSMNLFLNTCFKYIFISIENHNI